jgi:hypothetical protein
MQDNPEEGSEMSADDHEALIDHCAIECMNAIENKDKAAFKQAFEVLVVDILDKLSMDMEEGESA